MRLLLRRLLQRLLLLQLHYLLLRLRLRLRLLLLLLRYLLLLLRLPLPLRMRLRLRLHCRLLLLLRLPQLRSRRAPPTVRRPVQAPVRALAPATARAARGTAADESVAATQHPLMHRATAQQLQWRAATAVVAAMRQTVPQTHRAIPRRRRRRHLRLLLPRLLLRQLVRPLQPLQVQARTQNQRWKRKLSTKKICTALCALISRPVRRRYSCAHVWRD
jgi:hypothetical protein